MSTELMRELDWAVDDTKRSPVPLLSAAIRMGFDDWADVIRHARDEQHPVAIELLCRRVERGL